jgi:hypothetical protein
MCAGGATTTVYPTTIAEDVAYIISDSEVKLVFAEDDGQVEKLRTHREAMPGVTKVVTFTGEAHLTGDEEGDDWVISLTELEQLGQEALDRRPTLVDERIDLVGPDHLAVIIYTSGTTGRPKGAELTHDAVVYEAAGIDSIRILSQDDLQFLWLPLSHVFGKVLLALPLQIGFPTAIDGRPPGKSLHGGRATHLREGLRPGGRRAGPGERGQEEADGLGHGRGHAGDGAALPGQGALAGPAGPARAGRSVGAVQGPRALRRPGALLHLRLGIPQRRGGQVVRFGRPAHP